MCTCIYCFVLFVLCFCIVSFMYIYSYLLLVPGLLPPSENSIAVNNNNNNNNNMPQLLRCQILRESSLHVMFEIFDVHIFHTTIVRTFTYDLSLLKLYACSNSGQLLVL
jgi:hypothetical protein